VDVSISTKAINKLNVSDVLKNYNLVVDCTDSLPTKYLLNDFCVLAEKVLVYGSLYKHDGYIGTFNIKSRSSENLVIPYKIRRLVPP